MTFNIRLILPRVDLEFNRARLQLQSDEGDIPRTIRILYYIYVLKERPKGGSLKRAKSMDEHARLSILSGMAIPCIS